MKASSTMTDLANDLSESLFTVSDAAEREFDRLMSESSTLAFRVAYSVLRQREDAEDVSQEAFIKAHQHFSRLRDRDRFRAWLTRITWRLALNRQRANRRRITREDAHSRAAESVVTPAGQQQRATAIWSGIDMLPQKLRLTLLLAAIGGYDIREVAHILSVPEGTVKSRLFLAREQLKEILECGNQNR
jgi:RNA polymerase sigma-70 factor (ECF subfamily)